MVFSEKIKREAKEKAHYQCCVCRKLKFLEIHHITPQKEKGSDKLDNAVALCADCHGTYDGNPQKRKYILETRDFWYDHCKKTYNADIFEKLKKVSEVIEQMNGEHEQRIEDAESKINILTKTVTDLSMKQQELSTEIQNTSAKDQPLLFGQLDSVSNTLSGTQQVLSNLFHTSAGNKCNKCGYENGLYATDVLFSNMLPNTCQNCKENISYYG